MKDSFLMTRLTMPCGKYKGKLVSDIMESDSLYICWLLTECKTGPLGQLAKVIKGMDTPAVIIRRKNKSKKRRKRINRSKQ